MPLLYTTPRSASRRTRLRGRRIHCNGPTAAVFLHAYPDGATNPVLDSELRRTIRYRIAQRDLQRFLNRRRSYAPCTIAGGAPPVTADLSAPPLSAGSVPSQTLPGTQAAFDHPSPAPVFPTIVPRAEAAPEVQCSAVSAGMSSCNTFFAVLFAPAGYSMAVDIERTLTSRDMEAIAGLAFEPLEHTVLQRLEEHPEAQLAWFYRTWTTKEAVLKLGRANIFLQAKTVQTAKHHSVTRTTYVGTRLRRSHAFGTRRRKRSPARDMAQVVPDREVAVARGAVSSEPALQVAGPVHTLTVRLAHAITLTLASPTRFPAVRIVTGGARGLSVARGGCP